MPVISRVRYLLLVISVTVAGCTDGIEYNAVEPSVADSSDFPDMAGDSTSTDVNATGVPTSEINASTQSTEDSEQLTESDIPGDSSVETEHISDDETEEVPDSTEDDSPASQTVESDNETVEVQSFELSVDRARAELEEGSREGATIVVEVSPTDDESIELILEPEAPVDEQGLEVVLHRQRLDSENPGTTATFSLPVAMYPRLEHQRTFIVKATSGEHVETRTIALDIKPVDAADVYLLIGQSNMVGSSEEGAKQLASGGADELDSRIWQLNVTPNDAGLFASSADFSRADRISVEPRLIQAQDPLHEPLRANRDEKGGTKVGSGMSFARAALGSTSQNIYLVPAAWGGSGFCNVLSGLAWNAEVSANSALGGTGLLDRAIARLNMTLQETGGVFRGILWHQGEADSGRSACADSYAENLANMVERIRTDTVVDVRGESARGSEADIPFIVGTMSRGEDIRGDFSDFSDTKELVDSVHRQVNELIPYADTVINDDLVPPAYPCGSGSCVHFGSLAVREMGQRYYRALERVWER